MKFFVTTLLFFISSISFSQEICDNGIDDNGDGFIDLNDTLCDCGSFIDTIAPTSLIPNPSFELMTACPTTFSELSLATGWQQASDATSDYFNTCGYSFPSLLQVPTLLPFPDGNGLAGAFATQDYKEYIGACLTNTMTAGTSYTFQFTAGMYGTSPDVESVCDISTLPPLPLAIFGAPNCSNIPFLGFDCPPAPFVELGSFQLMPDSQYHLVTITFTPTFDVNVLLIGSSCNLPVGYPTTFDACFPYFIVDNLIVNASSAFESFSLDTTGSLCENNLVIQSPTFATNGTYQWYENGIAIVGQTDTVLAISTLGLNEGTYQLMYSDTSGCVTGEITILPKIVPVISVNNDSICAGASTNLTAVGANTYSWSPTIGLSSSTASTVIANPLTSTSYTIIGTTNGCKDTTTAYVFVEEEINVSVNYIPSCTLNGNQFLASGAINYTWSPAFGLSNTSGSTVNVTIEDTITYTIIGEVQSCFDTTEITVFPYVCGCTDPLAINFNSLAIADDGTCNYSLPEVILPNIFTPNNDGENDEYFLITKNVTDIELIILNRWGNVVFENSGANPIWDGKINGNLASDGVYFVLFIAKNSLNDKSISGQGTISIFNN